MTSSDNTPALNIPTCIEWKGDSFASSRPERPPTLTVSVEILQHVHQRFGKKFSLPQTRTEIEAVADNGCQTCTAGPAPSISFQLSQPGPENRSSMHGMATTACPSMKGPKKP